MSNISEVKPWYDYTTHWTDYVPIISTCVSITKVLMGNSILCCSRIDPVRVKCISHFQIVREILLFIPVIGNLVVLLMDDFADLPKQKKFFSSLTPSEANSNSRDESHSGEENPEQVLSFDERRIALLMDRFAKKPSEGDQALEAYFSAGLEEKMQENPKEWRLLSRHDGKICGSTLSAPESLNGPCTLTLDEPDYSDLD